MYHYTWPDRDLKISLAGSVSVTDILVANNIKPNQTVTKDLLSYITAKTRRITGFKLSRLHLLVSAPLRLSVQLSSHYLCSWD
jgi:hypothetical protein